MTCGGRFRVDASMTEMMRFPVLRWRWIQASPLCSVFKKHAHNILSLVAEILYDYEKSLVAFSFRTLVAFGKFRTVLDHEMVENRFYFSNILKPQPQAHFNHTYIHFVRVTDVDSTGACVRVFN